jgi:hypothetical protein
MVTNEEDDTMRAVLIDNEIASPFLGSKTEGFYGTSQVAHRDVPRILHNGVPSESITSLVLPVHGSFANRDLSHSGMITSAVRRNRIGAMHCQSLV